MCADPEMGTRLVTQGGMLVRNSATQRGNAGEKLEPGQGGMVLRNWPPRGGMLVRKFAHRGGMLVKTDTARGAPRETGVSVLAACTVLPRYLPGARRSVAPSGHGADLVHALSSPALSSIERMYASPGAKKRPKAKNGELISTGLVPASLRRMFSARERPREDRCHEPSQVPGFVRAGSTAIWPLGSDTPPLMLVTRLSWRGA